MTSATTSRTSASRGVRYVGRAMVPYACLLLLLSSRCALAAVSNENDSAAAAAARWTTTTTTPDNDNPHPDPNDEHYENMIYVGRLDHQGRRAGFENDDNGIRFIFGTAFDESHNDMEEKDLHVHPRTPVHDLPHETRDEILKRRRHGEVPKDGKPKRFGHVETHELDGGITPPIIAHVDPFFIDATAVTNKEFGKFVRATYYETEAEKYGWSFGLISFIDTSKTEIEEADPEAPNWVAVPGAYWRRPEGPKSTYKYREDHPVVHVSHRDAAEYCKWVGKRLPGEREWEAAARAGHWGPSNRTVYSWGDDDTYETAKNFANLWGNGDFPNENLAEDGWRGTSPVQQFPPNKFGMYDSIGNVWEWMRGGKHKSRIVRGASFVDTLDGKHNHAATLGSRATLHATTTTANIGFRCAKSPKRRVEYHFVDHDEREHGRLAIEDRFGKRDYMPEPGWEDVDLTEDWDDEDEDDDETDDELKVRKKNVIKRRETIMTEL